MAVVALAAIVLGLLLALATRWTAPARAVGILPTDAAPAAAGELRLPAAARPRWRSPACRRCRPTGNINFGWWSGTRRDSGAVFPSTPPAGQPCPWPPAPSDGL